MRRQRLRAATAREALPEEEEEEDLSEEEEQIPRQHWDTQTLAQHQEPKELWMRNKHWHGGRVAHFKQEWRLLGAPESMLEGMTAEWKKDTSWTQAAEKGKLMPRQTFWPHEEHINQCVQEMLDSRCVKRIQAQDARWIHPIHVVPKPGGKVRFILDCSKMNDLISDRKFKQENLRNVELLTTHKDYATSIDLTSAFFHIPVHPSFSPFLCFRTSEAVYSFTAMPFGAKSSPRVFERFSRLACKHLREHLHIRVVHYVDDILLLHTDPQELSQKTKEAVTILQNLGFTISMRKSELTPKRSLTYLGWRWDFFEGEVRMTKERQAATSLMLQKLINRLNKAYFIIVKNKTLANVIGSLNYLRFLIPLTSLYLRRARRALTKGLKEEGWEGRTLLSMWNATEFRWWLKKTKENEPRSLSLRPPPQLILQTDASSEVGWGASLHSASEELGKWQGTWTKVEKEKHITWLELRAVQKGLHSCQPLLHSLNTNSILVLSDASTVVSCIEKKKASDNMNHLLKSIFSWTKEHNLALSAAHIPGAVNHTPDRLSRLSKTGEYELKAEVLARALSLLGLAPSIDLFASRKNHKMERFCSLHPQVGSLGNALTHPLEDEPLAYAHPPVALIQWTLKRTVQAKTQILLVTPDWKNQIWSHLLEQIRLRTIDLGPSDTVLLSSPRMDQNGWKLPPGRVLLHWLDGANPKDSPSSEQQQKRREEEHSRRPSA